MQKEKISPESAFSSLTDIIRRLRKECPWDMKQTPKSLRAPLIEEAYEVVEAIDLGDSEHLKKELGDVLLHVIFQSVLAEEAGSFDLKDVIEAESEKLIFRHPHVFGTATVKDAEEVALNWEQLKKKEGKESIVDGVPASMPALQRAFRIQEKASKVGFDWPDSEGVIAKVREEIGEFLVETDPLRKEEEFGDVLFSLVNFSRHAGIDPESALRNAILKFEKRFRYVEIEMEKSGKLWKNSTLEELDLFWNKAKNND
jgi:XTP/dITP diphosphohydrolase